MNILPLIAAFALLFSLGTYAFLQEVRMAVEEKNHYQAGVAIGRGLITRLEGKRYRNVEKMKDPNKGEKGEKKKEAGRRKPYVSHRESGSIILESKLNLASLIDQPNPLLEKGAIRLIEDLYEMTSIGSSVDGTYVLATLLKAMREEPSISTLEALLGKIPPKDLPLFYKLIRGTQRYTLHTDKGYPSLADFVSIRRGVDESPIHFPYASPPVLRALLGASLTAQVMIEEKKKWEVKGKREGLNKKELEALLLKQGVSRPLYFDLLHFRKGKIHLSKEVIADEMSKIQVQVELGRSL